jgi:DNA-binding transcriptional MerR regulator
MKATYHIREFAALAGVTVKTLHHYDRVGLLKARRSGSGYRLYVPGDLERVQEIVTLKLLGFPLREIKRILARPSLALPAALRLQCEALESKREQLDDVIRAIRAAEQAAARETPVAPSLLNNIIEAIAMHDEATLMKRYYSDAAWEQRRRYYEEGPSLEWRTLYRDVYAALDADPGSERAQTLADRWLALSVRSLTGDPDAQTDSMKAWMDRHNWPSRIRRRIDEFHLEEVTEFIRRANLSAEKKYFSEAAWGAFVALRARPIEDRSRTWQGRVDLLRDAELWAADDPAGQRGQSLASRWRELMDAASLGAAGVRAGLLALWRDRAGWSPTLRWRMETLYGMSGERFETAAAFLDRALAVAPAA